jgi:hypothetical protein
MAPMAIREFSVSSPICDKLKSHSGTKKRFFKTGGGLVCPLFILRKLLMGSISVYVLALSFRSLRLEKDRMNADGVGGTKTDK